jgi:hypothetical protein
VAHERQIRGDGMRYMDEYNSGHDSYGKMAR